MKYCENCGKEIKPGMQFCPGCGTKISGESGQTAGDAETKRTNIPRPVKTGTKLSKKTMGLIGGGAVLLILLIVLLMPGKPSVNLKDYISVSIYGANGRGFAAASFDSPQMTEDLLGKKKWDMYEESMIYGLAYDMGKYMYQDRSEFLSNGDEVTVTIEVPKEIEQEIGIKLNGGTVKVKVENLIEPHIVNVPDYVQFTESGNSGNGSLDVEVDYDKLYSDVSAMLLENDDSEETASFVLQNLRQELEYTLTYISLSKSRGLSNGEVVNCDAQIMPYYAVEDRYGVVYENATFNYTMNGLSSSDFTLEPADNESWETIKTEADAHIWKLLSEEEYSVRNSLKDDGTVVWTDVKIALERIEKYYQPAVNKYAETGVAAMLYHISLPVLDYEEAVSYKDLYAIYSLNELRENTDGTLEYDWDADDFFYTNAEDALVKLDQLANNTKRDERFVRDAYINENIAEELTHAAFVLDEPEQAAPAAENWTIPELTGANIQGAASVEMNGHRYYRIDEEVDWKTAKKLAEEAGGRLAVVPGMAEQYALQALIGGGSLNNYWIGLSDEGHEGKFTWVTGEVCTWNGWEGDQPDNSSNKEDFVCIGKSYSYSWNDYPVDHACGYIVEVESGEKRDSRTKYLTETKVLADSSNASLERVAADSYGREYYGAFRMNASGNSYLVLDLKGDYDTLSATAAVHSDAGTEVRLDVAVFGDGVLLSRCCGLTRQSPAEDFLADVSGVNRVVIMTQNTSNASGGYLVLGNVKLTESEKTADTEKIPLSSLTVLQADSVYTRSYELWRDASGVLRENCIEMDGRQEENRCVGIWELDGSYTAFDAVLTASGDTSLTDPVSVKIYLDDEVAFEREAMDRSSAPEAIHLDLTGKETMKVTVTSSDEWSSGYVYLTGATVTRTAVKAAQIQGTESTEFPEIPANLDEAVASVADYQGRRFCLIEGEYTWKQAKKKAEQAGGHLATIETPEEQALLKKVLEPHSRNIYWLGGSYAEKEGSWKWLNGEDFGYTNWNGEEPNHYELDDIHKDYLVTNFYGAWGDSLEDEQYGFVMEFGEDMPANTRPTELASLDERLLEEHNFAYRDSVTDKYKEEHLSAYVVGASNEGHRTYDLNGEYTSISGYLVADKDCGWDASMTFAVIGDGKVLYQNADLRGRDRTVFFQADLTGVKTLTIAAGMRIDNRRASLDLFDVELVKTESPAALNQEQMRLKDLQMVEKTGYSVEEGLKVDTHGNVYDGWSRLDSNREPYVVYLLDGKYTEFSGRITFSIESGIGMDAKIQVYGDEVLLFETENSNKLDAPIDFTVDVTGVSLLKITAGQEGDDYGCLLVANDVVR